MGTFWQCVYNIKWTENPYQIAFKENHFFPATYVTNQSSIQLKSMLKFSFQFAYTHFKKIVAVCLYVHYLKLVVAVHNINWIVTNVIQEYSKNKLKNLCVILNKTIAMWSKSL